MPRAHNPRMLSQGYAPAADVARRLAKGLTTIHNLVIDGKVKGRRDGRMLYVDLADLERFYVSDAPNEVLRDIVRKYRAELSRPTAATGS